MSTSRQSPQTKPARKHHIVLITGATSGIGKYTALHLARRGHRVIASGRRQDALDLLEGEARDAGVSLETLPLDVTDANSIEAAHAEIGRRTDGYGIDALINNAGYGHAGPMSEVADEDLRRQYDTNVFGLMAVTRAFLPAMRERGYGKVLNVSSVGGRLTLPFFGAYNSTKYAVESMSDALRIELQPFGVAVVLIEPGIIRTNFTPRSQEIATRYGSPGAPFAGVMPAFGALTSKSDRFAVSPASVARAMARAVERRRPAARYIAPFRTTLLLRFYQLMPTRLNDWMFRKTYGLSARKLLTQPGRPALLQPGDAPTT